MSFEDCLNEHGLGKLIDEQFGRWGKFTQEAADTIIEVVRLEVREPGPAALINLASQAVFTQMNEGVFDQYPPPNKNGHLDNPIKWDIGPAQPNVYWTRAAIEIGEIDPTGLPESAVFGTFNPERFDGDPVANLRMMCRILLAIRAGRDKEGVSESLIETQVSHYCGPNSRDYRRKAWRKFGGLFREFFICYQELT